MFDCIQEKLHTASERLSKLEPQRRRTHKKFCFRIVSDDDGFTSFRDLKGSTPPCLFQMEPTVMEDAPTKDDLSDSASTLFYNLGISYRCLSALVSHTQSIDIQKAAFHMFKLSYSASARRGNHRWGSLQGILSLHNLVDMSRYSDAERSDYALRLRYELLSFQSLESALPSKACQPARAA